MYELRMGDRLQDGSRVYEYWQSARICDVLNQYVSENTISHIWSLLPDSLPWVPYHRVFRDFWRDAESGSECVWVRVREANGISVRRTATQLGEWLAEVARRPSILTRSAGQVPRSFPRIPGFVFDYAPC